MNLCTTAHTAVSERAGALRCLLASASTTATNGAAHGVVNRLRWYGSPPRYRPSGREKALEVGALLLGAAAPHAVKARSESLERLFDAQNGSGRKKQGIEGLKARERGNTSFRDHPAEALFASNEEGPVQTGSTATPTIQSPPPDSHITHQHQHTNANLGCTSTSDGVPTKSMQAARFFNTRSNQQGAQEKRETRRLKHDRQRCGRQRKRETRPRRSAHTCPSPVVFSDPHRAPSRPFPSLHSATPRTLHSGNKTRHNIRLQPAPRPGGHHDTRMRTTKTRETQRQGTYAVTANNSRKTFGTLYLDRVNIRRFRPQGDDSCLGRQATRVGASDDAQHHRPRPAQPRRRLSGLSPL